MISTLRTIGFLLGLRSTPQAMRCFAIAVVAITGPCLADSPVILNHDNANHLVGATSSGSGVQFVYDANGNLSGIATASVATLTSGTTQSGQVLTAGSATFFSFTTAGGASLALDLVSTSLSPATAALQVNVYNSSGGLVGSTTGASGTVLSLPGLTAGTYAVSIQAQSGAIGSFQVELVGS